MASMIDCDELLISKRMVEEMSNKTFETFTLKVDSTELTNQIQELIKTKQEVKDKVYKTVTVNRFMQYLTSPMEQWDTIITQNDKDLQVAHTRLKEVERKVESQKIEIMGLNSVAAQALVFYKDNVKNLEECLQYMESLKQELKKLQDNLNISDDDSLVAQIQAQLDTCLAQCKEYHKELQKIKHAQSQLEMKVSLLDDDLQQLRAALDEDQERMDAQCLTRLEKSISAMESLSGVMCKAENSHTISVQFPPSPSTVTSLHATHDLTLTVTFTFRENNLGSLRLSDVKSNMNSFDVGDVWKGEEEEGQISLPRLVHDIKQRWLSHVPLLAEINRLRSNFAVDWIQQENVLRVIVGKGGGIVCSLQIPAGYPHQDSVSLTSVLGTTQSLTLDSLKPRSGGRLEDWVQFLQDYFGKP